MRQSDDNETTKRMHTLLSALGEAKKFDTNSDELSVNELDKIKGGIVTPQYQKFLQYAKERRAKESKK